MKMDPTLEDAWYRNFKDVQNGGADRGDTRELLGVSFSVEDLTHPFQWLPGQRLFMPFQITDFFDCLSGTATWSFLTNKATLNYYDRSRFEFIGDYGQRLRIDAGDQITRVYEMLNKDIESRRAVLIYYHPEIDHFCQYPPCTIMQQFLVRNGRLDTFVTMRSNDLLSGALYDWTSRALLALHFASWLGVKPGNYYHTSNSLHYYTRESMMMSPTYIDQIDAVTVNYGTLTGIGYSPIDINLTFDQTRSEHLKFNQAIQMLFRFEHLERLPNFISDFWQNSINCILVHQLYRHSRWDDAYKVLLSLENSPFYQPTLLQMLRYLYREAPENRVIAQDIESRIKYDTHFVEQFIMRGY